MSIRNSYQRAMDWWSGLRWYWKILGGVPLLGILLLGGVALFTKQPVPLILDRSEGALAELRIHERRLEQSIIDKQRSIAVRLDATDVRNSEAVARLHTLMEAESMEELDELQKKWGL